MKKLVLHVPHSSTRIPFFHGYLAPVDELEGEKLQLTDWHTEDLFFSPHDRMVIADFSRVFCDPERFANDEDEIMSNVGMGVLYERFDDGRPMRVASKSLKSHILKDYYWPHHNKLSHHVEQQLAKGKAIILDCHSFPNVPHKRDLIQKVPRPDFNIGTDSFHTPRELIDLSKDFFNSLGYTLGIDEPYAGTIVAITHYQKDNRVQSIMLEVNRKLYLVEGTAEKSKDYHLTKQVVAQYINLLRNQL